MMPRRIDLSGTWKLRSFDGQRGDCLERILDPNAGMEGAWDARVPGDVHEALLDLGLIPEPTLGTNSLQCQWVPERLWYYLRSFTAPDIAPRERVWITFESLDLAARIYLNGREIGGHANRFHPFKRDITSFLAPGVNILVVQIESGLFHAMNRPASGMGMYMDSELAKRSWLRKVQSSFGWDWAPRLLTVGIPAPVYLEIIEAVRVQQITVYTDVSDDLESGKVNVRVASEYHGSNKSRLRLRVAIDELRLEFEKELTVEPGPNRPTAGLDVPAPELWWPVGHGAQRLYEVEVTVTQGQQPVAQCRRRIGFRHVRINQEPHPVRGTYFVLEVNKKPIFVKGSNFVPADIIDCRVTREKIETLIERALEANFNCLRIWGGGLYQSDAFYELCDARGILVWQEFIFAGAKYPAWDNDFLEDVKAEATYQIRRLAHHPSLFIWCGNNEIDWANAEWKQFQCSPRNPDHGLFHAVLPQLLREEDPSRFYLPSSPFSPSALPPNDPDRGDQHPWSVGIMGSDFRLFREMTCRFPNEGGFLGPTALPTVRACLPEGAAIGSFAWEHHENSISYWGGICTADAALEESLGIGIKGITLEQYVYCSGLLQGEALAEYIKNFRRRQFDSAAALFWMFNDVWPAVRSWTIVDYYLRRTPSFHPVRRAFAPVVVVVAREGDRVSIYGINDGAHWHGRLRFGLCALAGGYPYSQHIDVTIPANQSVCLARFAYAEWEKLDITRHVAFATLSRENRVVAQDRLVLPFFKEMHWPRNPMIEIAWDGEIARFSCDQFAWNICLDLDGEMKLGDNFFDLLPGVAREIPWPRDLGAPAVLHTGNQL